MTLPRVFTFLSLVVALAAGPASAADVRVTARDEPLASAARVPAESARTLSARRAPVAFDLVGLHWRGSGSVSFRTATATGAWSSWRVARPEGEDGPDRGSAEARARRGWTIGNPYWTSRAARIQYRLFGRVTRLRAHFVRSAPQPVSRLLDRQPMMTVTPRIIWRAAWGANESIVRDGPSYADRLAFAVVHHTAGANPSTPAESAAIVRGIQAYHVRSNGWDDIGYNFLVDRFGQIFEGRRGGVTRNVIGAHAQGFNTGSAGVAVLGSYGSSTVSAKAKEALVSLLAWRLDLGHVDPLSRVRRISRGSPRYAAGTAVTLNAIGGHRDTGLTSCPGSALYGELGDIRAKTAALGLPKLYDPLVTGTLGGPIRLTARLSAPFDWTVKIFDGSGATLAQGAGSGAAVDWTWNSKGIGPGRYTYSIDAGPSVRPATGLVAERVPLAVTQFGARPAVFTPNGDGSRDSTRIALGLTAPAFARVWLENLAGDAVTDVVPLRAVEAGTTSVLWNGTTRDGNPVPDGSYRLLAEASSDTEQVSASVPVLIDRTLRGLVARPTPFSPNADGLVDATAFSFELMREADTRVRIFSGSSLVATLVPGTLAAGPQTVPWDGRNDAGTVLPDGRYRANVWATTELGTRRLARDLVIDTTPPRVLSLSAWRSGGRTWVRVRFSEPSAVALTVGSTVVEITRPVLDRWYSTRVAARWVTARPTDVAANTGHRAAARVRR